MARICIWGDSITYGANDAEKGGWANRLNLSFNGNDDLNVYNLGISGDRTYDLIERFEIECLKRKPDVVLFAIGINDSVYTGSPENSETSIEKFRDNLQWLVDAAKKYTDKVGFVGLTCVDETKVSPFDPEGDRHYSNKNVLMYDDVVRDICDEDGLAYLHMFDLLGDSDMEDGLHPDAGGHEKMFLKIREFVDKEFL